MTGQKEFIMAASVKTKGKAAANSGSTLPRRRAARQRKQKSPVVKVDDSAQCEELTPRNPSSPSTVPDNLDEMCEIATPESKKMKSVASCQGERK